MRRWMLMLGLAATTATAQEQQVCGNGTLEAGEQCDDGVANSEAGPCLLDCTKQITGFCGDGLLRPGEACDDGNKLDSDGCSSLCLREVRFSCVGQPSVCTKTASTPTPEPKEATPTPLPILTKSGPDPQRAFELAVGLTLFGPPGLGLIYGPSAGHWYAGEKNHAIGMSMLRLGLVGAEVASAIAVRRQTIEPELGSGISITAGILLSTLVLVDILDASNAVRRAQNRN